MIFLKPNPCGLDANAQTLITRLYARLKQVWSVDDTTYNCFGLTVRNNTTDGYIPQYYDSTRNNYVSGTGKNTNGGLFFEDSIPVISFMGLTDPIKKNANGDDIATVQLLFFISNMKKITPGALSGQQQDGQMLNEIAVNDVKQFLMNNGCGFTITNTFKDVDKVLERYSGSAKKNTLTKDMFPYFCFRVDMECRYNINDFLPDGIINNPVTMWRSVVLFIKSSPNASNLIAVGNGRFIQAEYAPGNSLTPMKIGDSNGYLAGRNVQLPFYYNNQPDSTPLYDNARGVWDRTANAIAPEQGFNDGDFCTITFLDTI